MKYKPEVLQMLARDAEMMGRPIPDIVANVPIVDEVSQFYVDSFWELCTERQIGMGLGPIPINSILQYTKHYKMNDDEQYNFIFLMREMDAVYLKEQNREKK